MSATTDQILEQLKTLSLLEASELVKQIEEAFGVSAAASAGVSSATMPLKACCMRCCTSKSRPTLAFRRASLLRWRPSSCVA
jgi:hypothetical protein